MHLSPGNPQFILSSMNLKKTSPVRRYSSFAALIATAAALLSTLAIPWERTMLETLQPLGDTIPGEYFVLAAKYAGNGFYQAILICLLLIYACRTERRRLAKGMVMSLYAIGISGVAANILKFALGKARPGEKLGNWHMEPFSAANDFHSFPSGHTATSFALAYVLAGFYPRLALPLFSAATLIGAGRVIGESHFPSDVLGGALLGMACGLLVRRWRRKEMPGHQQASGQEC